ncbi:hypothetical protein LX64_03500 [Chitinophaga skermanii]|uniref:Copper-binding protein MbnP-like domain-containing protein n=1 Tax=Chitinophaga skermanii TaxID=331697 RepID=A0A327QFT0_9BACT|nr:MbnP family protein [Chitinophaga skermanii]RAJ02482.1 hypothetical protein LX64_03500 [Chitinophaga skermanii]
MKTRYPIALLHALFFLVACSSKKTDVDQPSAQVQIELQHSVGSKVLNLENTTYQNTYGEDFTVKTFKYYLSNFKLITTLGVVTLPAEYFLVDESAPATKNITLTIPKSYEVNAIQFMLGVDSARNNSGIQSGALDPLNGMFWSWNSGYIMAKLEGVSPASKEPTKAFTFHIGGYEGPFKVQQYITVSFPSNIHIEGGKITSLRLNADVAKWMDGPTPLSFTTIATIHTPGEPAYNIAQHYAKMFSFINHN